MSSSKAEDHEIGVFFGVGEEDVCVGFPSDGSFNICVSIHIVCSNGFGEVLQGEVCLGQKADVNEVSSGAAVNEGSGFDDLCSSSQFDREMNSSFIWQCY